MSIQSNRSPEVNRAEILPDPAKLSTMNYSQHTHNTAPTRFAQVGGDRFAYRRFGNPIGTPIVLLQHFMGNLDNYDPAVTDALASRREVILTDNAGVGLSTGEAPKTVSGMARDAASFIDALGLERAVAGTPGGHHLPRRLDGAHGQVAKLGEGAHRVTA